MPRYFSPSRLTVYATLFSDVVTRLKHIIDFADLKIIAIECGKCSTQVRLDATRADVVIVSECPACQSPFENIVHALESYRNVLKSITANKQHTVFVEVAAPPSPRS